MITREWNTGHRKSTTDKHIQRKRKRPRNITPINNNQSSTHLQKQRPLASKASKNHLLDPMLGPLLMASPDEAEYLLSRHPSTALSPYQIPKTKKHSRRRNKLSKTSGSKRRLNKQRSNSNNNNNNSNRNKNKNLPPLSHSLSVPTTSKNKTERLKTLHGGGDGKVTHTHTELDSNNYGDGGAEFRVIQTILKREHLIKELQRIVSTSSTRPYFATDIIYMLLDLRALSVQCIESIAEWRRPHSKMFNFIWEGDNYLLKMYKDTSFLKVCRPLGLCLSLPGIHNNPLLEFDDQVINRAEIEYESSWAKYCRKDPKQTINYDPEQVKLEQKQNGTDHMTRVQIPVMLVHAKHVIEDELHRLNLTHDRIHCKLIPTEEYNTNMAEKLEEQRRERLTKRRLEFELLKKRQNERDRKGFETEEDEKKSMSEKEWLTKKRKEKKEEMDESKKHPTKKNTESYIFQRNLLLKPKDRIQMKELCLEYDKLNKIFDKVKIDEKNLIEKTRRLELSLRSISQEGLLPQMMTDNDLIETHKTIQKNVSCDLSMNQNEKKKKKNTNVLERLLEESDLQDFVGGWRLKKLRSECHSVHERVRLLKLEMKIRKDDLILQKNVMNDVANKKEGKKEKKQIKRNKILNEKSNRLAKGLKNTQVKNYVTKNGNKNDIKKNMVKNTSTSINELQLPNQKTTSNNASSILLDALESSGASPARAMQELRDREFHRADVVRSNGVYPHASMLVAPQRREEGVIGGALPVMSHGGVGGVSVINNGIFLSRKVVISPSMKKRRSIVAERSVRDNEHGNENENKKENEKAKNQIKLMQPGQQQQQQQSEKLSPHRMWLAQKQSKEKNVAETTASSTTTTTPTTTTTMSPLKKYAPYTDTKEGERIEEKQKQDRDAYEKQKLAMIRLAKLKHDWFTRCLEHNNVWQRGVSRSSKSRNNTMKSITTLGTPGTPGTPGTSGTSKTVQKIDHGATSLPGSAASGLFSSLSLPSAVSGMTFEPSPSASMPFFTFESTSRSPVVVLSEMINIPHLVKLQYLISKRMSKIIQTILTTQLPMMTIQARQLKYIKPILAEKADSAREALAFTRVTLRTLQALNPSDGDALFLAHASRDVPARRVVDALQLLSISFGNANAVTVPIQTTSHKNRKSEKKSVTTVVPMKMGWDNVLTSLSEFDKTSVGPIVLKALKPLVRQLRLDIARRTENAQDDADIKPSLRAAKVIGTWLGSIVKWKEDYEGSLNIIEVLSEKKSGLERKIESVLGRS